MEHLRRAGQEILAAARMDPAVAEGAGEIIGLLTSLTQRAMAAGGPPEGGGAMPATPSMPPPPMA
jgi:hypothetical protein